MPSPKLVALALLWPHPAAAGHATTGVELENEHAPENLGDEAIELLSIRPKAAPD